MNNEIIIIQDSVDKEEDELSTSAGGSSDNEVSAPSEDEKPLCAAHVAQRGNELSKNTVLVAQVHILLAVILEMWTFLSAMLLGVPATLQQQAKAPVTHASTGMTLSSRPQTQARQAAKCSTAQRQPVAPPPGLSLPVAKQQRLAKQTVRAPPGLSLPVAKQVVAAPPGLSLESCEIQSQRLLIQRPFTPPPGLSLCHGAEKQPAAAQATKVPPGLEAFSPPPGIFFPTDLKEAPARRTRGRKKATTTAVGPTQPVPTECPKPPPTPPAVPAPSVIRQEFDQTIYRKELSDVLRDLANGSNNVAVSVRRMRVQNVPRERQAAEFRDILTRAAEENRGVARRLSFAFAAGLAAGEPNSAFAHEECLAGIQLFFEDVFEDLASEVPRLRNKLANELVPTLRTVFSGEEVARLLPHDCRPVLC